MKKHYEDLGFAKVDHHRMHRKGFPEVIYCEGKTPQQIAKIAKSIAAEGHEVLATRADRKAYLAVKKILKKAEYFETARIIEVKGTRDWGLGTGSVCIITAGTSDLPVAEEAAVTAEFLGLKVDRMFDVGVAGIHRLVNNLDIIRNARVVIVVAGMEGALPSVVGGLIDKPIIAVPTSVGYGSNFQGLSALLTMLNSCAPGIAVVNIDNGFGAAVMAHYITKIMRIAYFDAPSGLSGNMIVGALIDAGLDKDYLAKELGSLRLNVAASKLRGNREVYSQVYSHYQLIISKTKKHGIAGTYFNVKVKKEDKHRDLNEILRIIKGSKLSKKVKASSSLIFKRLAAAEAKVHGIPVNKVHFHEVGAVDAIIDIVGACIGFEKLGIEKVYCSPLPNGKGKIVHAHGLLPNPAPATAELLKGVPTYSAGIKGELVTPTGAAVITTMAESFGDMPRIIVEEIGYGAGSIDLPIPNLLRVFIGAAEIPTEHDAILQIEANIDDLDPKLYDRAIAKIMKAVLDASVQPIRMKKLRDAFKLEVLCRPEDKEKMLDAIFTETSTIGARIFLVQREKLRREIRQGKRSAISVRR